jgi:hypothetical protein
MKTFSQFILEAEKLSSGPISRDSVIPLKELEGSLKKQGQLPKDRTIRAISAAHPPTGAHHGKY